MADLTTRLNDIEALATSNHNALVALWSDTNTKLDTLIALMGGETPTGATLQDVVNAISAGNSALGTMGSDIAAIRAAISPAGEALPVETRSSVVWSLYRIMDAIQPEWPRPVGMPLQPASEAIYAALGLLGADIGTAAGLLQDIQNTIGVHTGGSEFTLASLVRAISTGQASLYTLLGALGAPWPADVLAALECICEATSAVVPPDPTDLTNPENCADPFVSMGFNLFPTIVPGYNTALIYATWAEPLPDGIEFGTSVLGELDAGILTSADWSQWRVFVQSDETQYADDPISPNRYPTNQWRTMEGSGARVFSVSERGSLKVYLCYDAPGLPAECIELTTSAVALHISTGGDWTAYPVIWPAGFSPVASNEGLQNGSDGNISAPGGELIFVPFNMEGWTWQPLDAGSSILMTIPYSTSPSAAQNEVGTVPAGGTFLFVGGSAAGQRIIICPPGVS